MKWENIMDVTLNKKKLMDVWLLKNSQLKFIIITYSLNISGCLDTVLK
jgi:hypothetical protein